MPRPGWPMAAVASTCVMPATDDAGWWLQTAIGDLEAARAILHAAWIPPRLGAELANQAAEKALKAVLVAAAGPVAHTHDLPYLVARCGPRVRSDLAGVDLVVLSAVLSRARYPDRSDPPITIEEATAWLQDAERVLEVAARHIGVDNTDVSAA